MTWLDHARDLPVEQVAEALGLEAGRPVLGRPTWSCPGCGAPTRHRRTHDRRGAVGITADGRGWRCFQCGAGGDGLDLVAFTIAGARLRDADREGRNRVATWFRERWPEPATRTPRPAAKQARPAPEATEPRYPPVDEVRALWQACRPIAGDAEVSRYLEGRALCPETISDLNLARAVPPRAKLPRWARGPGGAWTATGHRLICPLYDARGEHRSLTARRVRDGEDPKSLAPGGHERRGLVLADSLARQLLESGSRPEWWDPDVELVVVLAEGEPDWLSWATSPAAMRDSGHGPAVVGLFNGNLPAEMVAKLPSGTRMLVAEQRDLPGDDGRPPAGELYTARILRALDDRRRRGELDVEIVRPR